MIAHLTAFWHGDMDGPAFWLVLVGLGLLCIAAVATFAWAVGAITDYMAAHESPLEDEPKPRDPHARFESLILALVLMGLPVIALTR